MNQKRGRSLPELSPASGVLQCAVYGVDFSLAIMFSTMDSQPQEWLLNRAEALHTLCFCCFRDSKHARTWIHRLVPRNRNGAFLKWSNGGPKKRVHRRRTSFMDVMDQHFDELDFLVHCISSTEGQISKFANSFYLQNLKNITQRVDAKGRNCLVFQVSTNDQIQLPVLQAAKLLWIFFCVKYMKEQHGLDGFIYSDWFACDSYFTPQKAIGVSMVNFLLASVGIGLQVSISEDPKRSEADLLSDWLCGWCNVAKSSAPNHEFARRFEALLQRNPNKFEAVHFDCNVRVKVVNEGHDG